MKNFLILLPLVLLVGFYGYFSAVPNPDGTESSSIEIYPSTFDFGEIDFGDIVSHDFIVMNSGENNLEIGRIAVSCSCTSAKIDKKTIVSGEEGILTVTYDSGIMGRSHAKGREERIVSIRSNDPINPHMEITVYATIK